MAKPGTQPSMDDILDSIRSTVEEESAKNITGEGDAAENTPVEQPDASAGDGADDVLELSADDMAPAAPETPVSEDDEEFEAVSVGGTDAAPTDEPTGDAAVNIQAFSGNAAEKTDETAPTAEDAGKTETKTDEPAEGKDDPMANLDPDKSDEEVEAELDAMLAEVKTEDEDKEFPKMEAKAEEGAAEDASEEATAATEEAAPDAEKPEEPEANVSADDLDALMAGGADDAPADAKPEETPAAETPADDEPVADIDALLDGSAAAEAAEPELPDTAVTKEEATDLLAEAATDTPAEADANVSSDDLDALMAGAADEAPAAEAEPAAEAAVTEEAVAEVVPDEAPVEEAAPEASAPEPAAVDPIAAVPAEPTRTVNLAAIPAATGLQIGFPSEVLAEALRPLIQNWVNDNLPDMVEKLVREELEKLAEG